ncbi:MAG: FAD-dependent oxidoreductase [Sedimentisphaeraceae bacterium JB056]
MRNLKHRFDFCVVGGGLAGVCAAVAAARRGVRVALIQDRPVLGGNSSSEVRMWVCGAHGENNRETGIIEEILLENRYRNPYSNYSIWDTILYEKVILESNIELFLNTTCNDIVMKDNLIIAIKAWQMTTETWHFVEAEYFADCSGDSILAPLSGAEYRFGREARHEFDEDIAPEIADKKTMGLSCLMQAREREYKCEFIPPTWAYKYETDQQLNRDHALDRKQNFWWIEIGGEGHAIEDTEKCRDELLKICYGVWDHIKNSGDHGADNWELEWVGFLPGKRESRRYVGDYIITQNDVRSEGKFDDVVAFGGWPMDDHHPAGFNYEGYPTIFHEAPSPFGIPYRSLYSRNIKNLFFAGRNISATHTALSSTRVMATCALLGQAVGNAASVAKKYSCMPSDITGSHIRELQQSLLDDDCFLPGIVREQTVLTLEASLSVSNGVAESLRNGIDRPVAGNDNCWKASAGDYALYEFEASRNINNVRLVFDSDLGRGLDMKFLKPKNFEQLSVPQTLPKAFTIEVSDGDSWQCAYKENNNHQRHVTLNLNVQAKAIRFTLLETHGASEINMFSFELS